MKKIIFCAIMVLIFMACGPITKRGQEHVFWKNYEINQPSKSSTGSVMILISNQYGYPSFEPRFKQVFPEGILVPGQQWVASHALRSDESKYVLTSQEFHDDIGIIVNQNGEVVDELPIINKMRKMPFRKPWIRMPLENLKDRHLFVRKGTFPIEKMNEGFVAELIYGGVMNNIILLSYREFINDMARPAFYQDLKYDLNVNKVITFRSIKMKILEADNSKIVFQVIEDGDLPWMPKY